MTDEAKKYIKIALVISLVMVMCILVFTFFHFKELPFIYNEF